MKILAIESSCDETAAAVVEDGRRIISNIIATQVEEHKQSPYKPRGIGHRDRVDIRKRELRLHKCFIDHSDYALAVAARSDLGHYSPVQLVLLHLSGYYV